VDLAGVRWSKSGITIKLKPGDEPVGVSEVCTPSSALDA